MKNKKQLPGYLIFEDLNFITLKKHFRRGIIEAGCDEAGRGCLAGPVFAAAVILPPGFYHPLLNDSKQVAENNRIILRKYIEELAIDYAVAMIDNIEIDRINILQASFKAMHVALNKLKKKPELLLIDGNRFTAYKNIPHQCIVGGDAIYASIAAASILAKTYRDEWMRQRHNEYPHYGWITNKGYGTLEHSLAIEKYGSCKYHRKTFRVRTLQKALQ